MNKKKFKLIEDNSRPGYHLFEAEDGFRFWAKIMTDEEKEARRLGKVEISHLSYEQLKALGHLKGTKAKSFSEMTEEEQKLFSDDNTQG